MPRPVKEEVQTALSEFHARIRRVVERAWAEWRLVAEFRAEQGLGPVLYPRTVANDVFDAIARYAIAEFMGDDAVHIEIETQTIKLFFRSGVVGRFKKGDDDKLGRNVATQAVLAFVDPEVRLPGFPATTAKVEFIWKANDIQTKLEHVFVVARDNDRLLWDYEIEETAAKADSTVVPFPARPKKADHDTGEESLVTPKAPTIDQQEEE